MPSKPQQMKRPPAGRQVAPQWQSRTVEAGRKWYNSKVWQRIRAAHLAVHPYCEMCRAQGKALGECIPTTAHVDHITPHKGRWHRFIDASNLQTLCHACHSVKTKREQGGVHTGINSAH